MYVKTELTDDPLSGHAYELLLDEELNVKEVVRMDDESKFLTYNIKPNLPALGPKYGAEMGRVRDAIAQLSSESVVHARGTIIRAGEYDILRDEVLVTTVEKEGFASAQEAGYVVVLDTEITDELRDEGLAREIVHRIQNLRKDAGFNISDRITTYWQSDGEVRRVLQAHEQYVKDETLSLQLVEGAPPPAGYREMQSIDGHEVILGVEKA
jgi:isoleucyl-tRNA synthetase